MNSKRLSLSLLAFCALLATSASAGSASAPVAAQRSSPTHLAGTQSPGDDQAILQAIQDYANGFIQEDVGMLLDLWDTGTTPVELSYLATESDQPMVDIDTLQAYYQGLMDSLIVQSGEVSDLRIFHRGADSAYAVCIYHWVVVPRAGGPAMQQPTRATFLLHKRNGRWFYQHFHESITFATAPAPSSR